MPKVYGYIRVSTLDQANNGDSLDTQTRAIDGYCMMKGFAEHIIFVEHGVSGSVSLAERPQGQLLLGALEPGDVVVVAKLDRMFRNASDALGTLEVFKEQGVQLHMLDLGGDVTGNGISKLVFTILSAVAENERDRIRERIREVKRNLAAKGIYGGGTRPYGYDIGEGGRLIERADEQKMIAGIMQLHDTGMSPRKIGDALGMAHMTVRRIIARRQTA
ncbi:recombinase family protein [Mesorhizobium sp. 113-3-3]|uniref:recombinase family protein n=1 Tax=Mesorhizobium sp. 113-3-3 TaxID=2744516 RepID=UPI0019260491|nr:recombinase family protein [Mesorhizobium sp. 113-3-3]BCG79897.1 Rac prophage; site-specific recombinase [Mesorhizobium sp. 113-3-3]